MVSSLSLLSDGRSGVSSSRKPSYLLVLFVSLVLLFCTTTKTTYAQEETAVDNSLLVKELEAKLTQTDNENKERMNALSQKYENDLNVQKVTIVKEYEATIKDLKDQIENANIATGQIETDAKKILADANTRVEEANTKCKAELTQTNEAYDNQQKEQKNGHDKKVKNLKEELESKVKEKQSEWEELNVKWSMQETQVETLKSKEKNLIKRHEASVARLNNDNKENLVKLNRYRRDNKGLESYVKELENFVQKASMSYCNYTSIQNDVTEATVFVTGFLTRKLNTLFDINVDPKTQKRIRGLADRHYYPFLDRHVTPRVDNFKETSKVFFRNGSDLGAHFMHQYVVHKQCDPKAMRQLKKDMKMSFGESTDLDSVLRSADDLCKNHQWKVAKYLFNFSFWFLIFILFRRILWRLFVNILFLPITIVMLPFTLPRYFIRKLFGMNPDGTMKRDNDKNKKNSKVALKKKNQ